MCETMFPLCCLTWDQTTVEGMKIMAASFKRSPAHTAQCPWPCSRPLPIHASARDSWRTHRRVWVSLLWDHCYFLLSLGVHRVLFVPSKSLFRQSCLSLAALCGINGDLIQECLCHTQVCCTQSLCPCSRLLLTHTSAGESQTLKGRSGSVSAGSPGVHKVLFEPSEYLWWAWSLIINEISTLLLSCWSFSVALGHGVSLCNILLSIFVHQWVVIL